MEKNFGKKNFRKKLSEKFLKFKVKVKIFQGQCQGQKVKGQSQKVKGQTLCLFYYDIIKGDQIPSTYYWEVLRILIEESRTAWVETFHSSDTGL